MESLGIIRSAADHPDARCASSSEIGRKTVDKAAHDGAHAEPRHEATPWPGKAGKAGIVGGGGRDISRLAARRLEVIPKRQDRRGASTASGGRSARVAGCDDRHIIAGL